MRKDKNSSTLVTLLQVVLPVIGTIAVAYFGYLGLKLQAETPIRATQTAEAKQTAFAQEFAVVSFDNSTSITPKLSTETSAPLQPTETSISPTTSDQQTQVAITLASPSSEPTQTPIRYADPVQFVQDYYQLLNNRQYKDAWSKLSPKFQQNLADKGGYDGYVSFWDSVEKTEIAFTEIRSQNETEVYVYAEIIYYYKAGSTTTGHTTYKLVKDVARFSWLIDPN